MLTKTRTTLLSLIAAASFATATIAPAVSQADKAKTKVTCEGGFYPGETITNSYTTTVKGKTVTVVVDSKICGNDGKWHTVTDLEVSKTSKASKLAKEVSVETEAPKTVVAGAIAKGIAVGAAIG